MATKVAVATMKVAQVPKAGADFEIVEREIPKPDVGHVRIKVQACGVCHSDVFTKEGAWPGIQYRRSWLSIGPSSWKSLRIRRRNKTRVCFPLNPGTRRPRTCLRTI